MQADAIRAQALVAALLEREITLHEFGDGIEPLTSETIQVIATVLGCLTTLDPEAPRQLSAARALCCKAASASRVLS